MMAALAISPPNNCLNGKMPQCHNDRKFKKKSELDNERIIQKSHAFKLHVLRFESHHKN